MVTVNRTAPTAAPPEPTERRLEIDASSVEPAQNVILSRGKRNNLYFAQCLLYSVRVQSSPGAG
jgi:hypothetical protein